MTTPMFDEDAQGVPLKQLFPTFTADYDPDGSVGGDEESPTDSYSTERIEGEPTEQELQRDRVRAYNSDLSLEEQMSQFIAAPWDEVTEAEPPDDWAVVYNYVQLEQLKRNDPTAYEKYLSDMEAAEWESAKATEGRDSHILDC